MDSLWWQAKYYLQQRWAEIIDSIRDHPYILPGSVVVSIILWRLLSPRVSGRR